MTKKSKRSGKSLSHNSVPRGVKIISVLLYVVFAFLLLSGLTFLFSPGIFISSDDAQTTALKFFEDFTGSTTLSTKILESISYLLVLIGIIVLLFAALFFFTARGLWKGRRWARVIAVVFFVIGFIGALADILRGDLAGNIPQLIVDGFISGYLLFNKKVQATFSK